MKLQGLIWLADNYVYETVDDSHRLQKNASIDY